MITELEVQFTKFQQIADLVIQGVECWHKAGQIVCSLIDEDPAAIDKITSKIPQLSRETLRSLERIGRGTLLPQLMLRSGAGWQRLRMMPVSVQARFVDAPVEVLITTESGAESLMISVNNMSANQARQVFAYDGTVRDLGAQRAWLADEAHKQLQAGPAATRKAWSIKGTTLVVRDSCQLSKQELVGIIAEM